MSASGKCFAIVNAKINPRRKNCVLDFLRSGGIPWKETCCSGHAAMLAQESDADILIAVGGDGTLNEVVNGMNTESQKILPVPAGSLNILARHLGIRSFAQALALVTAESAFRNVDLISAEIKKTDNTIIRKKIVAFTSAGFDGKVASAGSRMRFIAGPVRYVLAGWAATVLNRPVKAELQVNGTIMPARLFTSILVNNGAADRFSTVKHWSMEDGYCELQIVNMPFGLHLFYAVAGALPFNGKYTKNVRNVQMSFKKPVDMMIDGELLRGATEFKAEVLPDSLSVLMPENGRVYR